MWKEYNCLTEGYWLEVNQPEQYMDTWDDVLAYYGSYVLTKPAGSTSTIGYPQKFPTVSKDSGGWFQYASAEAPVRASLDMVLGARADNNPMFPTAWRGWLSRAIRVAAGRPLPSARSIRA